MNSTRDWHAETHSACSGNASELASEGDVNEVTFHRGNLLHESEKVRGVGDGTRCANAAKARNQLRF